MIVYPSPKPVVKTAIAVLGAAFGDYAPVSAAMPKVRPARFVRVSPTGGSRPNVVTTDSRVLVELFAQDHATVEAMYSTASGALWNAAATVVDGVFIRNWGDEQGPVELPHPDIIDMIRWQFHGELSLSTTTA